MSENFKRTILRFGALFIVIALLFVVVLVRIVYIQTAERDYWLNKIDHETDYKPIEAKRGDIYDAQGRLLASSIPQYLVRFDGRVAALRKNNGSLFWSRLDSVADAFSEIVGDKTKAEYRALMVKAFNEKRLILLVRSISHIQYRELKKAPLVNRGEKQSGVYFEETNVRIKPFNTLGSRTIGGLSKRDGTPQMGLELRYDSYLRGVDGKKMIIAEESIPVEDAEKGCDLYTTLDANMMDICETALRKRLELRKAEWGTVVLMDVQTGEVKAISNLVLEKSDSTYYETYNYAVHPLEPGSTFKTVALMAAMDDKKVKMTDKIQVDSLGWKYYDVDHVDSHRANALYTIRQSLAVSSNIALAKIVTNGYDGSADKFVKKLTEMGMCDSIDYTIPGAHQAVIKVPKGDKATISKMAYGYSVELSPLQMLMFYNGIANNGKMVAPRFVREVRKDGEVVEEFETQVVRERMCDAETLENIKLCLHDVVWDNEYGTASVIPNTKIRKAQSDLVKIAGKTGTAQIRTGSGYSKSKHRISFVGYFPEENPQYSCICVINLPQRPYDSGLDCGIVVRQIAEKIMAYAGEYVVRDGNLVMLKNK